MKLPENQLGKHPKTAWGFALHVLILVIGYTILSNLGLYLKDNWQFFNDLLSTPKGRLLFVFLGSSGVIHLVLYPMVVWRHKRSYGSLISPSDTPNFKLIHIANLFAVILLLLSEPIYIALNWANISFTMQSDIANWALWLLPFFIAIFIQVTAEEIFFRGYLQQYIARYTSKRWLYIFIPAILWTLPHFNGIEGLHLQISFLIFIFTLAFIMGDIADRTKSLVFPIALHFFFNVFTICFYGNSLRPNSMNLIKVDYSMLSPIMQSGYFLLMSLALLMTYFLFRKRF